MEQIYKDRWTTLFEYLEGVDPAEFDMSSFKGPNGTRCAGGYLPEVFPTEWEFTAAEEPVLIGRKLNIFESMKEFFGDDMDFPMINQLFGGNFRSGWTPLDWIEHAMGVLKWEKQS